MEATHRAPRVSWRVVAVVAGALVYSWIASGKMSTSAVTYAIYAVIAASWASWAFLGWHLFVRGRGAFK